ncbi:hypothetical protein D4764_22G0004240 [Takifugu flavidus]|uniref:Uncharacterized protein n=1 Tax=Takifugu flavidus TaxID=433684 RepID=A0A5C6NGU8_9TELE|nr:hypothetical protein D4764_22G0004240 [Takifugu flavidus]
MSDRRVKEFRIIAEGLMLPGNEDNPRLTSPDLPQGGAKVPQFLKGRRDKRSRREPVARRHRLPSP